MKPYPAYRDSGVEWLGEVPKGWQLRRFKEFLTERTERSTTGAEALLSVSAYTGVTPRADSLEDGEFLTRAESLEGYKVCHVDDLVMNIMLAWNRAQGITKHAGIVSPAYAVFACDATIYPDYLNYLVRSDNYCLYFKAHSAGVIDSRLRLYPEEFRALHCIFPPLSEQRAIAEFLDREVAKIDDLVAEQRRLIALLAEKRQAVISHAVTRGLNPDAPLKPSGIDWLGDIPEGWEVVRLGALFDDIAEPGSDGLPILSVSIHNGVSNEEIADEDMDRKVSRSEDRSKYIVVRPGDLTYNMMRAWQGGFGAVQVLGMVSPAYVVARPRDPNRQKTEFIELLLRTPNAVTEMKRHSRGVTDFRLRLYWDEFKAICVAMPAVCEQQAILSSIAQEVGRFDALTETASKAIALLQERRAALISAAVTGKIDVRDETALTTEPA